MSVTATCGLLEDPDRFAGKRFDLGGGDLTGNDVLGILSRVTGRLFNYFQVVPLDIIRERKGEDGAKMYELFDPVGFTVDRTALRRECPDVAFHDFVSWAKDRLGTDERMFLGSRRAKSTAIVWRTDEHASF